MTFSCTLSQIPSEKQIARMLKKIIFGKTVRCPDCGRACYVQMLEKDRKWRCKKCRNKFSLISSTWLKGSKLSLQAIVSLVWCWQKQLNVEQAKSMLDNQLSIVTIRRYYALFRDHLPSSDDVLLQGDVQMDESFVKGAFIIGAKDIKNKKMKLKVIMQKHPTKTDAMEFIYRHVKPGTVLCTDGGGIYSGCENWWKLTHRKDIHSRFEFTITSEIEGIWGNLKTFIRRMYHHVTCEKLPKIVAEFEARYSQPEIFQNPFNYLSKSLSPVTFSL